MKRYGGPAPGLATLIDAGNTGVSGGGEEGTTVQGCEAHRQGARGCGR